MYGSIIFIAYNLYSMLTLLHVDKLPTKPPLSLVPRVLFNFYELWNLILLLHIKIFALQFILFINFFFIFLFFSFYIWIKTNTITVRTGQGK